MTSETVLVIPGIYDYYWQFSCMIDIMTTNTGTEFSLPWEFLSKLIFVDAKKCEFYHDTLWTSTFQYHESMSRNILCNSFMIWSTVSSHLMKGLLKVSLSCSTPCIRHTVFTWITTMVLITDWVWLLGPTETPTHHHRPTPYHFFAVNFTASVLSLIWTFHKRVFVADYF